MAGVASTRGGGPGPGGGIELTALERLGYDMFLEEAFRPYAARGFIPARVSIQHRKRFTLLSSSGELEGHVTGRFRHEASGEAEFPAVGDWVAAEIAPGENSARIHAILPRRGVLSRRMAGDAAREQILATNVNTLFIVTGLDGDFNVPRIERYIVIAALGGIDPVVILNKSDLAANVDEAVRLVRDAAPDVPVHTTCALTGEGISSLTEYLGSGKTGVLAGSSGTGKSTLINALVGKPVQAVREVDRKTDRGKHTTTRREMVLLAGRGIVIDTPGLREVHLWAAESLAAESFGDIESLAGQCRFNDCRHDTEPGCAVVGAIERGDVDRRRLENYRKLRAELRRLSQMKERRASPGKGRRPHGRGS